MTKYKAVRTQASCGTWCASKREASRLSALRLLEKAGAIRNLEIQPKFPIAVNGIHCFNYVADFAYFEGNARIVEDAKGFKTPVYRLKKRIVEAYYGIKIREV